MYMYIINPFLSHALVCDILEVMMRPNFDSPVHSLAEILERNMSLIMFPGSYGFKTFFEQASNPELRKIAETMIITKSWDDYHYLTKHGLLRNGTHAFMRAEIQNRHRVWGREFNYGRGFYRGEREDSINPYSGYFSNRTWALNEV